jgi:hypothetical protein
LFVGLSGVIKFNAAGVRAGGVYTIVNFNKFFYGINKEYAFAPIATLNSGFLRAGPTFCGGFAFPTCSPPLFNTVDGQRTGPNGYYKLDSAPEVIKIAAFVTLFRDDGSVDDDMVQYLSAILMAVREVNDKTDGVFDSLLPDSKIVLTVHEVSGFTGAEDSVRDSAFEVFGGTGIYLKATGVVEIMKLCTFVVKIVKIVKIVATLLVLT